MSKSYGLTLKSIVRHMHSIPAASICLLAVSLSIAAVQVAAVRPLRILAGEAYQANDGGELSRNRIHWFNTVLHAHSAYSDGNLTVQHLMQLAHALGCSDVAITDHNNLDQCRDPYFRSCYGSMPIRGEEWSTGNGHANILGHSGDIPIKEIVGDSIDLMIQEALSRDGLIVMNHPKAPSFLWGHDYIDEGITGIEVWNSFWLTPPLMSSVVSDVDGCPAACFLPTIPALKGSADNIEEILAYLDLPKEIFDDFPNPLALQWWHDTLTEGRRITAVGGSDFHYFPLPLMFPLSFVAAPSNSPAAIIEAIAQGHLIIAHDPTSAKVFIWADADGDSEFETITGDTITVTEPATVKVKIEVYWGEGKTLRVATKSGIYDELTVGSGDPWAWELELQLDETTQDFIRAELRGALLTSYMLSMTNPIYFNYPN